MNYVLQAEMNLTLQHGNIYRDYDDDDNNNDNG